MAEKVTLFKAMDGSLHETEQAADWQSAFHRVKTSLESCTGSDGEFYMDNLFRALQREELKIADLDRLANEKKPATAHIYYRS